jgi:hypothetical protein
MSLKQYQVVVQFKLALYERHDQAQLTVKIQEALNKAVLNMCHDAYLPMIPSPTTTTLTEK